MTPSAIDHRFRKSRMAKCLCAALAFGAASPFAMAGMVQNCNDSGPGSLRDVVAIAQSGDTIDLTQLPVMCGPQAVDSNENDLVNSVITLTSGQIEIAQSDLKLQGPPSGGVMIEVAPGSNSRVLNHAGSGLLVINDLTIAGGTLSGPGASTGGGCIYSLGDVLTTRSTVSGCSVYGNPQGAGGAIYARGSVALLNSTIESSTALGVNGGFGGGVFAYHSLTMIASSLSRNSASRGGGAYAFHFGGGSTAIYYSTIDHNDSIVCAGASLRHTTSTMTVSSSTISYNSASPYGGGGLCMNGGAAAIRNSTITFNSATVGGGGLDVGTSSLELQSTILALNVSLSGTPDLDASQGMVVGANNLVMTSNGNVAAGVIAFTSDPKLGPLQNNGGATKTHALLPGSPVIGSGNNYAGAWFDQRGRGYPRASGASYSTDIGAFQFDSIFYEDLEP